MCELTVSQQVRGVQDLGALLRVGDVQLVEVRLLQSCKVLQALETVHGEQRAQLLKHRTTKTPTVRWKHDHDVNKDCALRVCLT